MSIAMEPNGREQPNSDRGAFRPEVVTEHRSTASRRMQANEADLHAGPLETPGLQQWFRGDERPGSPFASTKPPLTQILIVDDSECDRLLIRQMLEEIDPTLECIEAGCLQEAYSAFTLKKFDVVMLDYHLPGTDGLDGIAALCEMYPACVIIMLSGQGDEMIATEAMKRGASDYLSKARMSPESIIRAMRNALEKSALRLKISQQQAELENFARVLVHDLRAPAASLQTFSSRIGEWLEEGDQAKALQYADWVNQTACRMTRLIETVRKYTLADAKMDFDAVDMNPLFASVLLDLQQLIQTRGAIVTADPLPTVLGNAPQLIQLLENLIGNGIKYCHKPNARIHLSSTTRIDAETGSATVEFTVADNGIGISKAESERIFEPFYRAGNASRCDGTGLGLATCKKIMERHGGQIWCKSALGEGTSFFFTLPAFVVPRAS